MIKNENIIVKRLSLHIANISPISDINDPISKEVLTSEYVVDEGSLSTLISFGFQENVARKALKASVR